MLIHKLPWLLRALCVASFFSCSVCGAALTQKTESVNVNISGLIVNKPSCIINDTETIEVFFGSGIGVNSVDGVSNRKSIPYSITCDDNTDALQLVLKITGTAVDFDNDNATISTTEKSNLGVKLYQNNEPFALNTNLNINADNIPVLEAVLVKRNGEILTEGEFNAVATIRAEYQ